MPHSIDDVTFQYETSMKLHKMQEDLAYLVENINKVQAETEKMMKEDKVSSSSGKQLIDKLEALRVTLVATKEGRITGEEQLRERLGWLYVTVTWYNGKPTDSQLDRIPGLTAELQDAQSKAENIYKEYLSKVNSELKNKGAGEIQLMTREAFDKIDKKS